jgi:recombination protein RecA|nr:MAG TPA: Protein recA [Caudoviricetes sp.]
MAKAKVENDNPMGLDPEVLGVISGLCKSYEDKNLVMVLGNAKGCVKEQQLLSTGSLAIDKAVGVMIKDEDGSIRHGIPRGRIVEIYGPESSGKTTFLNHMMAETQRQGKLVAMIDMEQTWDAIYAQKLGVDVGRVVFSQPSFAEQALNILESLLRTGKFGLICFDSIAALVPQKELEGQVGDSSVGVVARLMSQMLRKVNGVVNKTDTIIVFTNQIREKIGVMFGSPETTPGGNAMKFYASVRIDIRKTSLVKSKSGDVIGNRCKIKIVKNKVAAPFKTCEFDILYNVGIDRMGELVDLATDYGIFEKKGAWFSYSGELIGQGREASMNFLRENPQLADTIREEIVSRMYNDVYGVSIDAEEEEGSNSESEGQE